MNCNVLLFGVVGAFILASCSAQVVKTYEGADLPKDRVGVLSIAPPIQLVAIDGTTVPRQSGRIVQDDSHKIHFLPGPHAVTVYLADPNDIKKRAALHKGPWEETVRTEDRTLNFQVEAGRSYRVFFAGDLGAWRVWISEEPGEASPKLTH